MLRLLLRAIIKEDGDVIFALTMLSMEQKRCRFISVQTMSFHFCTNDVAVRDFRTTAAPLLLLQRRRLMAGDMINLGF